MKSIDTYTETAKAHARIAREYGPVKQASRYDYRPKVGDVITHGGEEFLITAVGSRAIRAIRRNNPNTDPTLIMMRDLAAGRGR